MINIIKITMMTKIVKQLNIEKDKFYRLHDEWLILGQLKVK